MEIIKIRLIWPSFKELKEKLTDELNILGTFLMKDLVGGENEKNLADFVDFYSFLVGD